MMGVAVFYITLILIRGGKLTGNIQLQGADSFENAKIVIEGIDNYYGYSDEEGNFEIKYIPAGSYTVTASKLAFILIKLMLGLTKAALPPLIFHFSDRKSTCKFICTQGADYTISLNWEHPDPPQQQVLISIVSLLQKSFFRKRPLQR